MKKTYIIPTLESIVIKNRKPLLTGSDPQATFDSTGGVAPGSVEGRYYDFDDEDEY